MSTSTCYLTINRFAKILIPSQEELYPAPKPSYKKNIVEHAFAYFGSLPGAWDFFRCADYLAQIFRSLPRMSAQSMQIAERVSGVLNRAGVAISLPKTCIDMINFKNSIKHLKHLRSLSLSSAQSIDDRTARAYKRSIFEAINLVNTASQAILFLNDSSVVVLGRHQPLIDVIFNVTSIVNDVVELVDESFKISYLTAEPSTDEATQQKINLSRMKIAKNIPSIVGSALALLAMAFSALYAPSLTFVSLSLNVVWLSVKIASNIYEAVIAESVKIS